MKKQKHSQIEYINRDKRQVTDIHPCQQEQMGDRSKRPTGIVPNANSHTMSSPASAETKEGYTGMPLSSQKHTPADAISEQIYKQVWANVQPKVQKQCEDAFKEFDNMFDVKSFNRGKQQANFDEIKFLSDLGHLPSRCFEECPYCARLIKIMEIRNER